MIQPTRRLVLVLAAGFPVALLPSLVAPPLWVAWAAALVAATASALADAALAVRPGAPTYWPGATDCRARCRRFSCSGVCTGMSRGRPPLVP